MNKKRILLHAFMLLGLAYAFSSCNSLKGSKVYQAYHNTTARFNGYFNAKEKMIEIEDKLFESHVDNYNKIIDVFTITDEKNVKTYTADCDLIIKKCSKVIQKHGTSKWIKNCYFVVGKADFYKRDYYAAMEAFEYVSEKYPESEIGMEAKVWMIRCSMENGKMNDAQGQIAVYEADKKFPVLAKPYLSVVEADYAIRTNDYKTAITKLEYALPRLKVKKIRTRYMFILAQLYQHEGINDKSAMYYKMVIKRSPPYELSFQSRLKLAEVSSNNEEVEAYLLKLLKDDKNISYYDQIYYTIAKVELKQGHTDEAIKCLKLSTRFSKGNDNQKAMSYMMEADIYFKKPAYPQAKMFYDSAAKSLTKEYPDYDAFKARQAVLGDLINNLITLQQQDSLLKISKLDTTAINKIIDDMVEANKQAAIQKQTQANNAQNNDQSPILNIPGSNGGSTGKESYFYNAMALSQGFSEFQTKWGNRARTDDWRRKNKPAVIQETQPQGGKEKDTANNEDPIVKDNPKSLANGGGAPVAGARKKYYQAIPFTQSAKNIANNKIQEALYGIGNIYYINIGDFKKAEDAYEELLRRFPDGNYTIEVHYNLYKIYSADSSKEKSDLHKDIILKKYPSSVYAQLIMNPDQLRSQFVKSKKNPELENLYSMAFQHFQANDCAALESDVNTANSKPKNYLKPKFEYLLMVCKGKKDSVPRFIESLKAFLQKYPGEDVTREVQKQIDYLQGAQKMQKIEQLSKDSMKIKEQVLGTKLDVKVDYQKTMTQSHRFLVVIPAKSNPNVVKTALVNYNNEDYASQGLQVTVYKLDDNRQVVDVVNFTDEKQALQYYKELEKSPNFYSDLALETHKEFIISDTNWTLFMKHKDVEGYLRFYKDEYL